MADAALSPPSFSTTSSKASLYSSMLENILNTYMYSPFMVFRELEVWGPMMISYPVLMSAGVLDQ